LTLTDAGARYLERVEPLLDALAEAEHEARGTGELRGRAARRAVVVAGRARGHSRVAALRRTAPGLRIELLIDDKRQDLIAEGVDIALRFGTLPSSSAVARRILTTPRVIVASPAYLARAGTPRAPEDLATHRAIIGVIRARRRLDVQSIRPRRRDRAASTARCWPTRTRRPWRPRWPDSASSR
jgi:DNA-binding transcriptional LysR family regulator